MTNQEILQIALQQSAYDCNCSAKDFLSTKNKVVISQKNDKARVYLPLPFECDLVSYGNNIVAQVSPRMRETVDFEQYYTDEWGNALSKNRKPLDRLAIGAFDNGKLVGLAGCSADCKMMYQIGVDVLPEYRRKGIASSITSRLAIETLKLGKVPFYCASWSNIKSVRNAIRSGFRPAWVELTARDFEFVDKMNG